MAGSRRLIAVAVLAAALGIAGIALAVSLNRRGPSTIPTLTGAMTGGSYGGRMMVGPGGTSADPGSMMGGGYNGMMVGMQEPMLIWKAGGGPVSSPQRAARTALAAVRARGWRKLSVDEVHVFPGFYEVEFNESGGFKGPEVYVNRRSGAVGPEMGPNLVWDTRYGVRGRACGTSIDEAAARSVASGYLQGHGASGGISLGDAERHHGYWEFELKRGGAAINQLNVNDCTRAVIDERMWQPDMRSTYAPNG